MQLGAIGRNSDVRHTFYEYAAPLACIVGRCPRSYLPPMNTDGLGLFVYIGFKRKQAQYNSDQRGNGLIAWCRLTNVRELILSSCFIYNSVWGRMVTLATVTDLTISRGPFKGLSPGGNYV